MGRYAIQASVFRLRVPFFKYPTKFVHGFYRLVYILNNGNIVEFAQLQGYATDSQGRKLAIGYLPWHRLKAHHCLSDFSTRLGDDSEFKQRLNQLLVQYPEATDSRFLSAPPVTRLPVDKAKIIYDKEDSFDLWFYLVRFVPIINQLNLRYPFLGFLAFPAPINSNSIYYTFALIGGLEVYRFPGYIFVGINQSIYNYPRIQAALSNNLENTEINEDEGQLDETEEHFIFWNAEYQRPSFTPKNSQNPRKILSYLTPQV